MLKQLKLIDPVPFYNAARMNSTRKYSLHSESSAESTPLEHSRQAKEALCENSRTAGSLYWILLN